MTTMDEDELVNLPYTDITSSVTSFEFTDGSGLTINQDTVGASSRFGISTDASGDIVTWLVGGYANSAQTQMQTNWHTTIGFNPGADFSETSSSFAGDYGFIFDNPGTWTSTSVPVPAAVWLFGSGLAGLAGIRLGRKKK
jgi:hypothetical protein